jgi:hypothetical protein
MPTIQQLHRDNRYARLVFLLHRLVFSSSVLSRILYQAVITERKSTAGPKRHLEKILWKTASGDDAYAAIFWTMMRPATQWTVLTGGALITLRNYLTELIFGLSWEGFGRYTTGVAKECFETKRKLFARKMAVADAPIPVRLEFERMYTIRIRASPEKVLEQLGLFGEASRGYLQPRWLKIQRVQGLPNEPGCVIRYEVWSPRFSFCLVLERIFDRHLMVYRVRDGYARGGILLFEIESDSPQNCNLSIYVAFNFVRGRTLFGRLFWWTFRKLFPAFAHDVIWNQALCRLKHIAEGNGADAVAAPPTMPAPALANVP